MRALATTGTTEKGLGGNPIGYYDRDHVVDLAKPLQSLLAR